MKKLLFLIALTSIFALQGLDKPETSDVNWETANIEKTVDALKKKHSFLQRWFGNGNNLKTLTTNLEKKAEKLKDRKLTEAQRNKLIEEINILSEEIDAAATNLRSHR